MFGSKFLFTLKLKARLQNLFYGLQLFKSHFPFRTLSFCCVILVRVLFGDSVFGFQFFNRCFAYFTKILVVLFLFFRLFFICWFPGFGFFTFLVFVFVQSLFLVFNFSFLF